MNFQFAFTNLTFAGEFLGPRADLADGDQPRPMNIANADDLPLWILPLQVSFSVQEAAKQAETKTDWLMAYPGWQLYRRIVCWATRSPGLLVVTKSPTNE